MQQNLLIFTFPFIAALIGWFTNYLAVRMLFRPRKPIDLKIFTLQGLLPKKRNDVATNIATTINQIYAAFMNSLSKHNGHIRINFILAQAGAAVNRNRGNIIHRDRFFSIA